MIYEYLKYYKGYNIFFGLFGCAFERFESTAFNTQKVGLKLKKKYSFDKKKLKTFIRVKKMVKTHIWQKLKNEVFTKKTFC
jgi:hypothetical protein